MIIESHYWVKDIKKQLKRLSKINIKYLNEKTVFEIEKSFFYTAYAIRKLYQSNKITDDLFKQDIILNFYKPKKLIHKRNWWNVDELYDLNNANKCSVKLDYLTNQIIHSYTFLIIKKKNKYKILFHSDKNRNKLIYAISIKKYINLLKNIIELDITNIKFTFDKKSQDYKLITK